MSIISALNNRLYDGILFPAIGFNQEFSNKNIEIEYSKYFCTKFFSTAFILKVKLNDYRFPYRRDALEKIYNYGLKIKIHIYDAEDASEIEKIPFDPTNDSEWNNYKDIVISSYLNTPERFTLLIVYNYLEDYIGDPKTALWCIRNKIRQIEIGTKSEVCNIGYIEELDSWVGWGYYGSGVFGMHDAIFDKDTTVEEVNLQFGFDYKTIEDVPFRYRGTKIIANYEDMKKSAKKFAEYI
jgi:hypothetical protein